MLARSNSTLRYAKIAAEKIGSTAMAGKTVSVDLPLLSNHIKRRIKAHNRRLRAQAIKAQQDC
jgi:hypothetical protein